MPDYFQNHYKTGDKVNIGDYFKDQSNEIYKVESMAGAGGVLATDIKARKNVFIPIKWLETGAEKVEDQEILDLLYEN